MFKSKTKYTWEGWDSSGREDWVFGVKHPCELMGAHAKLIDKELKTDEKIEGCLYAPRVSATSTPFGLVAEESSYGLCVTDKRLIISKDRHAKEIEPVVTSIDFDDILYFHIGSVLLLSWFSVTYIRESKLNTMPIIFYSNGKHHFERALRAYKKYCVPINTDAIDIESFSAGSFLYKIKNSIHRNYLKTLISTNEKCILSFSSQYIWEKVVRSKSLLRREKIFYPASRATVMLTNKSIMLARDSLEFSIGSSVDVLIIPLYWISSVALDIENMDNEIVYKLRFSYLKDAQGNTLDISLTRMDVNAEIFIDNIQLLLNKK